MHNEFSDIVKKSKYICSVKISFVSMKGEISKQNASKMHDLAVAGTCLTDCTRDNKCSDKSTSVGVGVCVGECAIDCIVVQF
ncbi:hypothetical protein [Riemerella anatipestifer]|nr:hypothetical protein [Riemerella anatipestifer]QZO84365.1 hypothetical protein K6T40_07180 [Riemerella anatipestifer]